MQRVYGRDLAWYEHQFEVQGFGCAVCKDGPKTRRLHIDHDHRYRYVKIDTKKIGKGYWVGAASYNNILFTGIGKTKSEVIQKIKQELKEASVRGLLCHRCNRALILLKDDTEILAKAAEYLKKFQAPQEAA